MEDVGQSLGIQDLRAIIHGLRMSGFAFISEEEIKEQVSFMIEALPTPEALNALVDSPVELKNVKQQLGEIMKLIEKGGRRDENFKIRFEAKKNMPPRYKVLKWRSAMNYNELTKGLIKISMFADDKEQPVIAERAIGLAKKSSAGLITEEDINEFKTAYDQTDLSKEAGLSDWWAGMKGGVGGAWQGAKNVGHMVADPMKTNAMMSRALKFMQNIQTSSAELSKILQQAEGFVYNQGMKASIGQMIQSVAQFKTNADQVYSSLNEITLQLQQTSVPTGGAAGAPAAGAPAAGAGEQAAPAQAAGAPAQAGGDGLTNMGPDSGMLGGTSQQVPQGSQQQPSFQIGQKVKFTTKSGEESEVEITNIQDNGNISFKYLTGPRAGRPGYSNPSQLRAACERYRMMKEAQAKKWIRVV